MSGRYSVTMSPSLHFVLEENKAFAQIKNALAGNATVTFQVDVDLACDETFYVTNKDTGEVRALMLLLLGVVGWCCGCCCRRRCCWWWSCLQGAMSVTCLHLFTAGLRRSKSLSKRNTKMKTTSPMANRAHCSMCRVM